MGKKYLVLIILSLIAIGLMVFLTINVVQSNTVNKQLSVAKYQYETGKYKLCIDAYNGVLDIDASNLTAYVGIAKCYSALGELGAAEQKLLGAIELLPNEELLYLTLADIYIDNFFIDRAIEIIDTGLTIIESDVLVEKLMEIDERLHIEVERDVVQKGFTTVITFGWMDDDGEIVFLEVDWEIDRGDVGSIELNDRKQTVFQVNEVGTATLSVTLGSVMKHMNIEVKEQVLYQLTIDFEDELPFSVGEQITLVASGYDFAGVEMSITPSWRITNNLGTLTGRSGNSINFIAEKEGIDIVTVFADQLEAEVQIVVEGDLKRILLYETSGSGTVVISPQLDGYSYGTNVTIEAVPSNGWEFVRWDGHFSDQSTPFNLTISEDILLRAIFERKQHTLTVRVNGEGDVIRSSLASTFSHMHVVTLTARSKAGWEFVGWEGDSRATTARVSITMDQPKTITATFVKVTEEQTNDENNEVESPNVDDVVETYTLTTRVSGEGQVTRDNRKNRYERGTNVTLTAVPGDGWEFLRWEGDATSTSATITVKVNSNKTVRAVFKKIEKVPTMYELSTSISGEGTISRTSNATSIIEGSELVLTAEPKDGWVFLHWTGDVSSRNSTITVVMNRNIHVQAVFARLDQD